MKTTSATTMPQIQPSMNPTLVAFALGDNNVRIAAMMGIGLIAMPSARGRISPITGPISGPRRWYRDSGAGATAPRTLGRPEAASRRSLSRDRCPGCSLRRRDARTECWGRSWWAGPFSAAAVGQASARSALVKVVRVKVVQGGGVRVVDGGKDCVGPQRPLGLSDHVTNLAHLAG